jgi:hypothetical protein
MSIRGHISITLIKPLNFRAGNCMLLNVILIGVSNFFDLLVTDVEMLLGLRGLFIKGE